MATADELVESIKTLTDTVVEHAKSTDARIDALATEVRDLAAETGGLAAELRDGFRNLDRRISRLENGTGPVASNR